MTTKICPKVSRNQSPWAGEKRKRKERRKMVPCPTGDMGEKGNRGGCVFSEKGFYTEIAAGDVKMFVQK